MINYWKILLEVAILWYVIYMMLVFIKGTRTEQLLKGVFIIGVIFLVTQQLKLDAINWVITRLFPLSVVAFLIIFQPELRKGLARLGQIGMHEGDIGIIDEISAAAEELSQKKTGALIVIEREVGLKSYIESGVSVDAAVSAQLIRSIFLPQSPLHDGAVIIQHERLAAAACILPLPPSDDKRISRSHGMRHRAAIGISEETDAVSVVVSEETGAISIAANGHLAHIPDVSALRKHLKNLFYMLSSKKLPFKLHEKNSDKKSRP